MFDSDDEILESPLPREIFSAKIEKMESCQFSNMVIKANEIDEQKSEYIQNYKNNS
jgi:hypothetical protein